jgi:hypothetical protein
MNYTMQEKEFINFKKAKQLYFYQTPKIKFYAKKNSLLTIHIKYGHAHDNIFLQKRGHRTSRASRTGRTSRSSRSFRPAGPAGAPGTANVIYSAWLMSLIPR